MNEIHKKKPVKSRELDMLHGSLLDKILWFALPLAASSILQQLFNSADVAVVGRFAGSQALAAVGSNQSAIGLFINLFVGLSIGANVLVARYIGQGEKEKISDAVHTTMTLAGIGGIFLLFLGMMIARPMLRLMATPEDVIDLAVLYLRIYFLGMPFFMLYNFGAAILRSKGDTKRPLYCLFLSGCINVVLNLILVIVFHLGVAGVGIATVVSNIISACMVVSFLMKEEDAGQLSFHKLCLKRKDVLEIGKIGVPAGVQGMVFSLSNVMIQTAINGFGSDAVAGSAAAVNFEFFTYFLLSAFSQAAVTFVSQNYGAGQYERCKKIVRLCAIAGILSSTALAESFVLGGKFFIRFYSTDPVVTRYAMIRMTHILALQFLNGLQEVLAGAMRGMGYSFVPAAITVAGVCGIRFVWIYTVFEKYHSFEMLMNVYPVSWIVTSAVILLAYRILKRKVFTEEIV